MTELLQATGMHLGLVTLSETARREVLARLLKLNHERYAEEVRQGLPEKKKTTAKKPRKARVNTDEGSNLFK